MAESVPDRHPSIIPGLRYADAPAAIEWLCEAFGFEATLVVPGEQDGTIAHAQLVLGNGMVMLGSAGSHAGSAFDEAMRPRLHLPRPPGPRLELRYLRPLGRRVMAAPTINEFAGERGVQQGPPRQG